MRANYVLVDFENVQVKSLALLAGDHFRVYLFLGANNKRFPSELAIAMHAFGDRAKYVKLESNARDALDIQIGFYAGELATIDPGGFFHIISKDKGFDPLIQHLKEVRKVFAARSETIEEMPYFRLTPPSGAAGAVAPSKAAEGLDALVNLVLTDLEKRKAARPRRLATLRNTVFARLGKENESAVEPVVAALVRAKYVLVDGEKVSYNPLSGTTLPQSLVRLIEGDLTGEGRQVPS